MRLGLHTKGSYVNEAHPYVLEYIARSRLAKLGFTQSLGELDCITADALLMVDLEYAEIQAKEQKAAMDKVKVKGKGRR